jgi:hypothetical protein
MPDLHSSRLDWKDLILIRDGVLDTAPRQPLAPGQLVVQLKDKYRSKHDPESWYSANSMVPH